MVSQINIVRAAVIGLIQLFLSHHSVPVKRNGAEESPLGHFALPRTFAIYWHNFFSFGQI